MERLEASPRRKLSSHACRSRYGCPLSGVKRSSRRLEHWKTSLLVAEALRFHATFTRPIGERGSKNAVAAQQFPKGQLTCCGLRPPTGCSLGVACGAHHSL